MPVSEINGVELSWQRGGRGPRLLFCNGSGSTLADARPMLDRFADGFDLLAWDYRGFGRSGPVTRPYRMADLARDAAGLLELVGWDTCRILGVSFGGMVAQELAVTAPDRVECLVLACTSAGGAGGSSYPLHTLGELPPQEQAETRLRLADSRWDGDWLATHPADRVLAHHLATRQDRSDPVTDAARRAQLRARADHDVWDRLDTITCPTLVAYGRYDAIAPPQNSAAIASRIPGADLRGYEGGHLFLFQDPAATPDIVTFLHSALTP